MSACPAGNSAKCIAEVETNSGSQIATSGALVMKVEIEAAQTQPLQNGCL